MDSSNIPVVGCGGGGGFAILRFFFPFGCFSPILLPLKTTLSTTAATTAIPAHTSGDTPPPSLADFFPFPPLFLFAAIFAENLTFSQPSGFLTARCLLLPLWRPRCKLCKRCTSGHIFDIAVLQPPSQLPSNFLKENITREKENYKGAQRRTEHALQA